MHVRPDDGVPQHHGDLPPQRLRLLPRHGNRSILLHLLHGHVRLQPVAHGQVPLHEFAMRPAATDILANARARWRVLVVAGVALVVGGVAVYRSGLLTSRSDAARAEAAHASSIREG